MIKSGEYVITNDAKDTRGLDFWHKDIKNIKHNKTRGWWYHNSEANKGYVPREEFTKIILPADWDGSPLRVRVKVSPKTAILEEA